MVNPLHGQDRAVEDNQSASEGSRQKGASLSADCCKSAGRNKTRAPVWKGPGYVTFSLYEWIADLRLNLKRGILNPGDRFIPGMVIKLNQRK